MRSRRRSYGGLSFTKLLCNAKGSTIQTQFDWNQSSFRIEIKDHLNMNIIGHQWNDTKHPLNHCSKVWLDGTFLSLELPVILLFRTSLQITEKFHFDANIHLIRCPFLIFSQTIFPVAKSEQNLSKMRCQREEFVLRGNIGRHIIK